MNDLLLVLERQLSQLEFDKSSLEEAILEIYRRMEVLNKVDSWNPVNEQDTTAEYTATDQIEYDPEEDIEWIRASPAILPA